MKSCYFTHFPIKNFLNKSFECQDEVKIKRKLNYSSFQLAKLEINTTKLYYRKVELEKVTQFVEVYLVHAINRQTLSRGSRAGVT